jgi:hypothetical protein
MAWIDDIALSFDLDQAGMGRSTSLESALDRVKSLGTKVFKTHKIRSRFHCRR